MSAVLDKEVLAKDVIKILSVLSGVKVEKIKMTDLLVEDLGLDSLKRMEALSRISDQHELDPDMEKAMEVRSVADVMALMEQSI